MEILIDDNTLLSDIQKEFNSHFPYLKLEFFEFDISGKIVNSKEHLIKNNQQPINMIRHIHLGGHISMNGHQKVSTFEQHFKENFGVNVQVFRKSGNTWLQTTTTDSWTLAEQNKKGEEMRDAIAEVTSDNFEDYHEQK